MQRWISHHRVVQLGLEQPLPWPQQQAEQQRRVLGYGRNMFTSVSVR
ncbi:hypothetical protein SPB21_03345 [Leptothoe sp. ISB3NOV94-8A]|nr:hypothetical protein [Leptothoe sp. LEGE 181152]